MRLNKQTLARSRAGTARLFAALPYRVLVEWFLAVRLIILTTMSLLAFVLLAALFYLVNDGGDTTGAGRALTLNTELIDTFEVWLEERQTEREQPVISGSREYFKQ